MAGPTRADVLELLLERLGDEETLDDLDEDLEGITEPEKALLRDLRRELTFEEVEEARRRTGPEFFQKILRRIEAEEKNRPR